MRGAGVPGCCLTLVSEVSWGCVSSRESRQGVGLRRNFPEILYPSGTRTRTELSSHLPIKHLPHAGPYVYLDPHTLNIEAFILPFYR